MKPEKDPQGMSPGIAIVTASHRTVVKSGPGIIWAQGSGNA